MTEQEALLILGLQPGASAEAIDDSYHNLIAKLHPDESGARYLSRARDTLLRRAGTPSGGDGPAHQPAQTSVPSIPEHKAAAAAAPSRPPPAQFGPSVGRATPAAPRPGAVHFLGTEGAYWRLLVRGSLLLAVTLGIYRFWLTTDIRRFLWSNTEVAGETLEYTGTARELLLGFLIAMAILIPLYAVLFIAALNLGTLGQIAAPLSFIVLTVFGHYAVYRARRYRLTRTVYRGVRFHQSGSAWRYAGRAVFWWLVIAFTLGLAYPFAQANLERYKMRNTWLGDVGGRFDGTGRALFGRGFLMWLAVIGPLLAGLAALIVTASSIDPKIIDEIVSGDSESAIKRLAAEYPNFAMAVAGFGAALVWSFLAALLLYPVFQALVLRWWVSGLRFGDVSLTSQLRTGQVYGTYLSFIGWSLVLGLGLGIFLAVCLVVVALVTGNADAKEMGEAVAAVILVASYVVLALAYAALYQVKVKLGLWRITAESTDLSNVAALARISAVGAPASPVGEGLADALNVGGF
jgi:uncharacterized membrane protein YjgN (DUF898 family)